MGMLPKLAVGIVALGALATGGYFIVKEQGVQTLSRTLQERLASGEYLAALAAAGKMREEGRSSPELEATITNTARLLIAEDSYKRAVKAHAEERYVDVRALLAGNETVTDASFKYHKEAAKLLAEAEAFAAGEAHKAAVTISNLEAKAGAEQKQRRELEQNKKSLESALSSKEQSLVESRSATEEAKRMAEASEREAAAAAKEAEAKQAALLAEQARAKQLMEQVEKESKQKFFNELRAYRDLVQKGKEQLDNAVTELNGKRDVTALVYVSQGRILFEEAKSKAAELRAKRTPSAYVAGVDDLVRAAGEFLESSKQLRNAVAYMEEQGSAEFAAAFGKGKTALQSGVSYLSNVSSLLASNL